MSGVSSPAWACISQEEVSVCEAQGGMRHRCRCLQMLTAGSLVSGVGSREENLGMEAPLAQELQSSLEGGGHAQKPIRMAREGERDRHRRTGSVSGQVTTAH